MANWAQLRSALGALWGQMLGDPSAEAAVAPASVSASPLSGSSLLIEWVPGSGGGTPTGFDVQIEVPAGSGNWIAASGAANPTAAGVTAFTATGLSLATPYPQRVRAKRSGFPDSAWTVGAAVFTDNSGTGGGTIPVAPAVTTSPASQTVTEGATVTLSVVATGTAPLAYQWRRNGAAVSGATSASYAFTAALADNGASYDVQVSNGGDTATSTAAVLTVNAAVVAPTITLQPVAQNVFEGATATFFGAASGTAPITFQWRRNGVNIVGATGTSYSLTATLADNGAVYSYVASNAGGSTPSTGAALTVTAAAVAPAIVVQPTPLSVPEGGAASFSVAATGTAPLGYQWRRDGVDIPGATAGSYAFTALAGDDGAEFSVRVSNVAGSVLSAPAALTILPVTGAATITSSWLANNAVSNHVAAPFTCFVNDVASNALVLTRTGLVTEPVDTPEGLKYVCRWTDTTLTLARGALYAVRWLRTDTGDNGFEILRAS